MSIGALVVLSLALGLAAWLAFLWSVKSGQYDDPEGPKYRMMADDEEDVPQTMRKKNPEPDGSRGDH
jgi:cbb3-type cytochrome oxidase maturation protein